MLRRPSHPLPSPCPNGAMKLALIWRLGRWHVRTYPLSMRLRCCCRRLAVPQREEQRALEDELRRVLGARQAVQQPLDAVARQDQVEVFLSGVRVLLEPGPDRRGTIGSHAVMA